MNNTQLILPDWIGVPSHIKAISTTRYGGCSSNPYDDGSGQGGLNLGDHVGDLPECVEKNRTLLNEVTARDIHFLNQIHSNIVVDANDVSERTNADACVSADGSRACAVMTADCLPVLLTDSLGRVVAAAHAGWRGLASGVLQNTVARMRELGSDQIIAWLGPAIGPNQFEVGVDVVDIFARNLNNSAQYFQVNTKHQGKYLANIYGIARATLAGVGVSDVFGGSHCTVSEQDKFYSYRRDGVTGRMASIIWIEHYR